MEPQLDPARRLHISEARAQLAPDDVPVARVMGMLWRRRRGIAISTLAGGLLGALLVLVLPSRYAAATSFIAESGNSQSGGLGALAGGGLAGLTGLAGQLGVSLPVSFGGSALPPDYFMALIGSRMVRDSLLATRFDDEGNVVEHGGKTLLELLPVRGTGGVRRERAEKKLANMMDASVDRKSNVVTLTVTDQQPLRAQSIANRTIGLLNWYNVSQRQSRSRLQREFAEKRLQGAQAELDAAESAMEEFALRNRVYQSSPALLMEYQRLQRRAQQKSEVVLTLVRTYETSRISESGELPVLSVIDRAPVPARPSFPRLLIFLPLGLLLGAIAGVIWAVARSGAPAWRDVLAEPAH